MLQPHSQLFFVLDEGSDDLIIVPKAQITRIDYDRATGQASIDLASQPTLRFDDTEENLLRVLGHRDFTGDFKRL